MAQTRRMVIFDLDGTLTRPHLDFDLIRREIGVDSEPILEAVGRMTAEARSRAEAILVRHESEAAAASVLQAGAAEVIAAIRKRGWPVALMTRNTRDSVQAFQIRHGIEFDLIRTREDGPFKPSPEPVLDLCGARGIAAANTWVVGDYHYDILCGNAAGATTVLLWESGQPRPAWADEADHVISKLSELLQHLDEADRHGDACSTRE